MIVESKYCKIKGLLDSRLVKKSVVEKECMKKQEKA